MPITDPSSHSPIPIPLPPIPCSLFHSPASANRPISSPILACSCCWAFAGVEAASDRLCISTNGSVAVPLSAQDVCFCASDDGCQGGQIDTPWQYIQEEGAVTGGQFNNTCVFPPPRWPEACCVDLADRRYSKRRRVYLRTHMHTRIHTLTRCPGTPSRAENTAITVMAITT